MPTITLTFANELNTSVQVGDTAYYVPTSQVAGGASFNSGNFDTAASSAIVEIGIVTVVNNSSKSITCDIDPSTPTPSVGNFIFFSKDNRVNTSGLTGYYATAEYRNYSKLPAEMFATSVNYVESSK